MNKVSLAFTRALHFLKLALRFSKQVAGFVFLVTFRSFGAASRVLILLRNIVVVVLRVSWALAGGVLPFLLIGLLTVLCWNIIQFRVVQGAVTDSYVRARTSELRASAERDRYYKDRFLFNLLDEFTPTCEHFSSLRLWFKILRNVLIPVNCFFGACWAAKVWGSPSVLNFGILGRLGISEVLFDQKEVVFFGKPLLALLVAALVLESLSQTVSFFERDPHSNYFWRKELRPQAEWIYHTEAPEGSPTWEHLDFHRKEGTHSGTERDRIVDRDLFHLWSIYNPQLSDRVAVRVGSIFCCGTRVFTLTEDGRPWNEGPRWLYDLGAVLVPCGIVTVVLLKAAKRVSDLTENSYRSKRKALGIHLQLKSTRRASRKIFSPSEFSANRILYYYPQNHRYSNPGVLRLVRFLRSSTLRT